MFAWALLVGCGPPAPAPKVVVPPSTPEEDLDLAACGRLCAREHACSHADVASCRSTCARDAARMKRGFVAAYVRCYLVDLDRACTPGQAPASDAGPHAGPISDEKREALHLRCFDEALAPIAHDGMNQEDMALAVCDRSLRCKLLDKLGRDACIQATLDPKEPEVKLGQRLVDGLRRERVLAFRKCVDDAPCPKVDTHDDAVDACYQRTIAGS